jgi:hypothetical protein
MAVGCSDAEDVTTGVAMAPVRATAASVTVSKRRVRDNTSTSRGLGVWRKRDTS